MFRNRFIGPGSLSLIAFVAIGLAVELPAASAQTAPRSPADTLIQFYKLMRERHYREAFAISIYRPAVDGLEGSLEGRARVVRVFGRYSSVRNACSRR